MTLQCSFSTYCWWFYGSYLQYWPWKCKNSGQQFIRVAVLVLAGIELNYFIVVCMGLCFGFVLKTVLIMQWCFSYCWALLTQHWGLFCSSHCPAREYARVHRKLGGDTAGTADPNWPKGYPIPYDIMLSNKTRGEVGEGAAAQGLAGHQTVGGKQLFSFALLSWALFFSLLLFSSFPHNF